MLSIRTLTEKPNIVDINNENIIDFSAASFYFNSDVSIIGSGIVTDELEMRPDLVSKIYYNDISKVDYILKFNGISNPFSLERGTILLIGDATEMKLNFQSGINVENKKDDIRKRFFDENRLSKKDIKRLELVKKKSEEFANGASNLPPNFADIGSQEIKVKDGIVIFGGDVVANKSDCPEVLSRARVKAKLLEKRMFKDI